MKIVSFFGILLITFAIAGCSQIYTAISGYTVINHPEVEVRDDSTGKFMIEAVSVGSDCQSCHAEKTTAGYDYYAKNFNGESLEKAHDASSETPAQGQMAVFQRGQGNYVSDSYGYYYQYPWWFDNSFFAITAYNVFQPNSNRYQSNISSKQTFQNDRRSSGVQRYSRPVTPARQTQSGSTSTPPSNANTTRTRDSGKDDGSSKKRDSGQGR
jgi:hypothetical protein